MSFVKGQVQPVFLNRIRSGCLYKHAPFSEVYCQEWRWGLTERGDEINWITYRHARIKCILTKGTVQVDIDAGIKPLIHTKAISYRKVRHPFFIFFLGEEGALSYSPFKKSR